MSGLVLDRGQMDGWLAGWPKGEGVKVWELTWRKSSWRVRMRVMRSRTAVSTVARETSPCLNTHHLVPPRTVRGGSCSWNCPCWDSAVCGRQLLGGEEQ